MPVDLRSLVERLNEPTRKALEAAAGLALAHTHYEIDIEHVLTRLLDQHDGDFAAILRQFELEPAGIARGLDRSLQSFKTGNGRPPGFSPRLATLLREAWLLGSLQFGARAIRSGHLILALVGETTPGRTVNDVLPLLNAIRAERLNAEFPGIVAETAERELTPATHAGGSPGGPTILTALPHLDAYTIDLTAEARAGRIDPVIGRDIEVRQIVDILTRRRQNNPILLGEAGVGKTAVVEGFALRIAAGNVPPALKDVALRTLDLGLMQAGAGVKGEFERRLKAVIQEVKSSPQPIVLFIDEAHQLIGAGGQAGQGDAANLLKPDLARGELRVIAATTWGEYKKYVERDAALTRRFQVVRVEEPSEAMAVDIMRGLAETFETHHKVRILDEAVRDAVRLSKRYIPARQLPDKSVSLLDTAASMVAMSRTVRPAPIEDIERERELAELEVAVLRREAAAGADHAEALHRLDERLTALDARHQALSTQWESERDLLDRLTALRADIQTEAPDLALVEQGKALEAALAEVQGETPLLHDAVDGQAVAKIVAGWTGIPVGRMVTSDIEAALDLDRRLGERIVGQGHAITTIADAIRTSKAKLLDPRKPPAVFLLVGTSGVGKTETALALADILYGGEQSLTVINMSEFKEEHKVSMLVGSPPGYVGYGEGGVLTEAVRRRPYGVLLLDEMEKAHPGVQDVFYQVFDKGTLRDGEGRDIDFRNTTILMASNAGTETLAQLAADPETMPDGAALAPLIKPELLRHFKPAFLGRVSVVPYLPLDPATLRLIVDLQIDKLRARIFETYRATLKVEPAVLDQIVARCRETDTGARTIEHILAGSLMPALSRQFLSALADRQQIERVTVGLGADGTFNILADRRDPARPKQAVAFQ